VSSVNGGVSDEQNCGHHGERSMNPGDFCLPRHLQRIWDGSPIEGRRVLIRCYHGLGDTIQFIRFVPAVMARASSVHVWAQPELLPLLQTMTPAANLLPLHDGAPDVAWDVDLELMEVPEAIGVPMLSPALEYPYLQVAPLGLTPDDRPSVGLYWRAGPWDPRRSIAVEALRPVLSVSSVRWVIAQPDATDAECTTIGGLMPNQGDLVHYASLLRSLDLLITVDSMPAHLAGALGVPTWVLLHADPDWRWQAAPSRCPAYPTLRLFRQSRQGDWSSVVHDVRRTLTVSCRTLGERARGDAGLASEVVRRGQ
jgi:hypothetical protein